MRPPTYERLELSATSCVLMWLDDSEVPPILLVGAASAESTDDIGRPATMLDDSRQLAERCLAGGGLTAAIALNRAALRFFGSSAAWAEVPVAEAWLPASADPTQRWVEAFDDALVALTRAVNALREEFSTLRRATPALPGLPKRVLGVQSLDRTLALAQVLRQGGPDVKAAVGGMGRGANLRFVGQGSTFRWGPHAECHAIAPNAADPDAAWRAPAGPVRNLPRPVNVSGGSVEGPLELFDHTFKLGRSASDGQVAYARDALHRLDSISRSRAGVALRVGRLLEHIAEHAALTVAVTTPESTTVIGIAANPEDLERRTTSQLPEAMPRPVDYIAMSRQRCADAPNKEAVAADHAQ